MFLFTWETTRLLAPTALYRLANLRHGIQSPSQPITCLISRQSGRTAVLVRLNNRVWKHAGPGRAVATGAIGGAALRMSTPFPGSANTGSSPVARPTGPITPWNQCRAHLNYHAESPMLDSRGEVPPYHTCIEANHQGKLSATLELGQTVRPNSSIQTFVVQLILHWHPGPAPDALFSTKMTTLAYGYSLRSKAPLIVAIVEVFQEFHARIETANLCWLIY